MALIIKTVRAGKLNGSPDAPVRKHVGSPQGTARAPSRAEEAERPCDLLCESAAVTNVRRISCM